MQTQDKAIMASEWPPPLPAKRAGALTEVVSDRYCRAALARLRDVSGSIQVSELARDVAAAVREESPDEVPENVHRRIRTVMHFGHLPTLDEHGIVVFDADDGLVTPVAIPD